MKAVENIPADITCHAHIMEMMTNWTNLEQIRIVPRPMSLHGGEPFMGHRTTDLYHGIELDDCGLYAEAVEWSWFVVVWVGSTRDQPLSVSSSRTKYTEEYPESSTNPLGFFPCSPNATKAA